MKLLCCHTVELTQVYCFVQHLLEVSAVRLHACPKTLAPLVNCIVNDALVDVTPHVLHTLFQFISVVHPRIVHSLLDDVTDPVINRIKVSGSGLFAGQRSGGTRCLLEKSHIARAGVLGRCRGEFPKV